ncbi:MULTISPECIES: PIN domain-containing protein [unclassified Bradyrhizobium]|uniref:PIN domain-containing protein n=1 Tax=Bradyrhizobium TaxID=374 RepID=UPI0028EDFEBF|nr:MULTISPECIES: PIN domain-containing protein [unclassified Bradyrhizobium]
MILLDTNVISEVLKLAPAMQVIRWLDVNFANAAISSITILELGAGVAMLDDGRRKDSLQNAISRTIRRFGSRVYAFDAAAAQAAVQLVAIARARGLPLQQIPTKLADLQIAGIASAYGLDLATRNAGDFAGLGLSLINPWNP